MQALAGEKGAKMLGESDERGSYISRSHVKHCTRRKVKRRKLLKAFERQDEAFKGL